MNYPNMNLRVRIVAITFLLALYSHLSVAQVSTVEYGKSRVQYRKFKWQYLQTDNFNTYFYENGKPIANFAIQMAEEDLPGLEKFVEYGLQRRINLVVYNHFNEMEQSNIGLNIDWQTGGGVTKLVNNKVIVYFNGDHADLRRQVRQGIARVLVENLLFGDDLGEFAANKTLLDLPKWMIDGYIEYAAEKWNTTLDDQLKSALLSGDYKNFYQFSYEKPLLAGHAFWYHFTQQYKNTNATNFLNVARAYKNLNQASLRLTKLKFKDVLSNFMISMEERYAADLRGRKDVPKGNVAIVEEVKHHKDYFHFTPNPSPKNQSYAVAEYIKGKYSVVLYENMIDRKVLYENGVRSNENELNLNYPHLAWDGKGTRLACIYQAEGKLQLFVYDMVARFKKSKQVLTDFEQILDMKYMLNENTLLLSAVRKGQSDIFIYNIEKNTFEQVTNDIYADLDASYVSFPNKQGIIFSSNRPSALANGAEPIAAKYNIFLADIYNKSDFRQITQLTQLSFGDARYPMQYNTSHFTFISDETGIHNRFAGFFHTERAGLDSVYVVGEELLRNPDPRDLDSTLKAWGKTAPDSVFAFSITRDSAYVFPLTNYTSSLRETKIAGDKGLVSEVRQQGNLKFLYKLKVDEVTLRRRNINPKPTEYRKSKDVVITTNTEGAQILDSIAAEKKSDLFDSGFETDTASQPVIAVLKPIKKNKGPRLFDYELNFSGDNFSAAFNNDVLVSRYEPFTGSLPVMLNSENAFNGMLKASVFDLFEDIRFSGAIRLPMFGGGSLGSVLSGGGEWYARADYLKHRWDYSFIYYRKTNLGYIENLDAEGKIYSNLYQGTIKYPFDRVRSLKLSAGVRLDRIAVRPYDITVADSAILKSGYVNKQAFALARLEYVHDDALLKTTNIYHGLRYKVYADLLSLMTDPEEGSTAKKGRLSFNFGTDFRYYYPIYRNFIWAARAAADFSWGDQKMLYYLGGVDSWISPKYNSTPQALDASYAYQTLAVNMRGFKQNISNGNNAIVLNSEFRLPLFSTLLNRPINNAFIRNFQLTQFIDLGSAWNGTYNKMGRNQQQSTNIDGTIQVTTRPGGIGPFVGGYGFGARSILLGYFMRLDAAWEMNAFFKGKPIMYFGIGVDF